MYVYLHIPNHQKTHTMKNSITTTSHVANEILNQLGGVRFLAMTGATVGYYTNTIVVKFKGCRKFNIMFIELTGFDTYTVRFAKTVKFEKTNIHVFANLYADQLQDTFRHVTGLYTHL